MGGYLIFKNYNIDHTTIHEVLHTYDAEDLSSSGYIMTGSGSWDNVMHLDTYNDIDEDRYDGAEWW